MWLITPIGFFSIVQKPGDKGRGTLTIRAQDGGARTAFHSEGFIEVRADGVYVLCQACESAPKESGKELESRLQALEQLSGQDVPALAREGAPDNVVRTVTENSRTLKFTSHGFEKE